MRGRWIGVGHGARMMIRGMAVMLGTHRRAALEFIVILGASAVFVAVVLPFIRGVSLHHAFALWIMAGLLAVFSGACLAQLTREFGLSARSCRRVMATVATIVMGSFTLAVVPFGMDLGLAVTAASVVALSAVGVYLLVAGARAALRTGRRLYEAGVTSMSAHERLCEEARRRR